MNKPIKNEQTQKIPLLSHVFSPPKHQVVANTKPKKKKKRERERERTTKQRTGEESKLTQKITAKQRTSGFFRFPYHLFSKKPNKEKKINKPKNPENINKSRKKLTNPEKHQAK